MTVARQATLWQWAAVAYGVCAVLFITYFPGFVVQGQRVAMIQLLGPSMLVPVSIPVVAIAVVALLPWRRSLLAWLLTAALVVFIVATALSFGLLYLPAAAFSAVAAYLHHRAPIEDAPPPLDEWQGVPRRPQAGPE